MSESPFKCPTCGKEFKSKLALAGHKGRSHGATDNRSEVVRPQTVEGSTMPQQDSTVNSTAEKVTFTVVNQEKIPLEGVPGQDSTSPTQPTPDAQVQTASAGFTTMLQMFANRWNDSLEPGAQEPGPGQFKITDKEIGDLDVAIQGVLAKHGGDEGVTKFLLEHSAEISLAIIAASIVGKVIGGTMAKRRKFSPQQEQERKPLFNNPFKKPENPGGVSEKDQKEAAEIAKQYWGQMPSVPTITPGSS
jgi:hypothetical protein